MVLLAGRHSVNLQNNPAYSWLSFLWPVPWQDWQADEVLPSHSSFPADSSPVGLHGTQESYSCGFRFSTWNQSGTNNQSPAGAASLAPPPRPNLTPLLTPPLLSQLAGF